MNCDIIVGAHYGDEGKSKFIRYYSDEIVEYNGAIKIGGYSRCKVYDYVEERFVISDMLPAAKHHKESSDPKSFEYIFPSFSFIDLPSLKADATTRHIDLSQIIIDHSTYVQNGPMSRIVYANAMDKEELEGIVVLDVMNYLNNNEEEKRYIIEGQFGYGLAKKMSCCDWIGSTEYRMPDFLAPTTYASGIASILNIPLSSIEDIILVTRLNENPNQHLDIVNPVGNPWNILLFNKSVNPVDRIDPAPYFPYDIDLVKEAINVNDPTMLVVNFLDQIDGNDDGDNYSEKQLDMIAWIEEQTGCDVDFVSNGEENMAPLLFSDNEMENALSETVEAYIKDHPNSMELDAEELHNAMITQLLRNMDNREDELEEECCVEDCEFCGQRHECNTFQDALDCDNNKNIIDAEAVDITE